MTKKELRAYYLNQRNSLSKSETTNISSKINGLLKSVCGSNIQTVHSFLPIPNSKEVDIWPFIDLCWEKGLTVATSVTHFNPKRLEHSIITRKTKFESGVYNTLIPSPLQPIEINKLDLVIVPLLCIDKFGNRIGYGQGFYDGFLSKLDSSTKKIGVSMFDVLSEKIETDEWDVKLDSVITPFEVIEF